MRLLQEGAARTENAALDTVLDTPLDTSLQSASPAMRRAAVEADTSPQSASPDARNTAAEVSMSAGDTRRQAAAASVETRGQQKVGQRCSPSC